MAGPQVNWAALAGYTEVHSSHCISWTQLSPSGTALTSPEQNCPFEVSLYQLIIERWVLLNLISTVFFFLFSMLRFAVHHPGPKSSTEPDLSSFGERISTSAQPSRVWTQLICLLTGERPHSAYGDGNTSSNPKFIPTALPGRCDTTSQETGITIWVITLLESDIPGRIPDLPISCL